MHKVPSALLCIWYFAYSFYNLLVEACIAFEKTVVGTDVVVETIVKAAEINNQTCLVSMQ